MIWSAIAAGAALWPALAGAACRDMTFEGRAYTLCEVTAGRDLRLFHSGPTAPMAAFGAVNAACWRPRANDSWLCDECRDVSPRPRPVGPLWSIEEGVEARRIVTGDGPGNFGLLPNGVFCVGETGSGDRSRAFAAAPPDCRHATQSGPMLVIDGKLHPRLCRTATALYPQRRRRQRRWQPGGLCHLERPVNFHAFARLFRDGLGLPDALYFDGNISRLHAPELGRQDAGFPMGPIVGLVVPAG
jgi:uncharacterized protein YigE (DUF2233 family)